MTETRNSRRTVEGVVTSDKMLKTITVLVERTYKHPKYKKYVRKQKKYHAHDEDGTAKKGDRVEIVECRPMSKLKRWRLVRIVEKSTSIDADDFTPEALQPKAKAGVVGGGA
jgi:small subunit ribosomal protein S17